MYILLNVSIFKDYDKYIDDFANYSFDPHGLCYVQCNK